MPPNCQLTTPSVPDVVNSPCLNRSLLAAGAQALERRSRRDHAPPAAQPA
ncbi:hypothetical protein [Alloactinosynnema sp. L-07]|nr:hypothetical protein [Alloactinosynnema sp. L-07]